MTVHNFELVNGDTDSIMFKKQGGKPFTEEERESLLDELNNIMPELIKWEDDNYFKTAVVVRKKNYVLEDEDGNVKIKGSGLKGTMKERALQEFMSEVVRLLLKGRKDHIMHTYLTYVSKINTLVTIDDWCFKKTVTKSVLEPERTNEDRVKEALDLDTVSEGDKVYLFYKTPEELCLREEFDGTYDADKLYKKLFDTLCIFETLIDVDVFPNFALKRNKELLSA